MKRRGYRFGVEWIALNDDPTVLDPQVVASTISVALLGDLFGKMSVEVAEDVVKYRERERAAGMIHDEAGRS